MRARILVLLLAIALLLGASGACSLNPQPVPPGLTDNGADEPAPLVDASTKQTSDAGGGNSDSFADSEAPPVSDAGATVDSSPITGLDGDAGDAGDAPDAEPDGAADAESDASSDAAPE